MICIYLCDHSVCETRDNIWCGREQLLQNCPNRVRNLTSPSPSHAPAPSAAKDAQYDGQISKASDEGANGDDARHQTTRPADDYSDATAAFRFAAADDHRPQQTTAFDSSADYQSTNSFVGGAQIHHSTESRPAQQEYSSSSQQQTTLPASSLGYTQVNRDQAQEHLAKHQAEHQAQLARLMAAQQQQTNAPQYQTKPPHETAATLEQINNENSNLQQNQHRHEKQQEHHQHHQQQQGYDEHQKQQRTNDEGMVVNENPIQVPIQDQQSLIPDNPGGGNHEFGVAADDAARQKQEPAVYSVYQAYYAPKGEFSSLSDRSLPYQPLTTSSFFPRPQTAAWICAIDSR